MFDSLRISAVDTHCHYNHGARHDTVETPVYRPVLDYMKQLYDTVNIEMSFCSTFASVISAEDIVAENEYAWNRAKEIDWLYQWVVVDPRNDETFLQADRMLHRGKCIGIKVHPVYHEYSTLEYGDKLFSYAAQKKAAVQIHRDVPPSELICFADRYPGMKLILAHLGSADYADAINAAKHRNIYCDTSGQASYYNAVIEYTVDKAGSDRILFGTDTYSPAFQRGRIEGAMIRTDDKINILRRNALELFAGLIPAASGD